MKLHLDPTLSDWAPGGELRRDSDARLGLAEAVAQHAEAIGTPTFPDGFDPQATPIILTGHQAQLWHPGIFAKDLAAHALARKLGGVAVHHVVDQDVHEAWSVDRPQIHTDPHDPDAPPALSIKTARHGTTQGAVPTGSQPPAELDAELTELTEWPALMPQALTAARDSGAKTLAMQVAVALHTVREALGVALPVVTTTDLAQLPVFQRLVDRMLDDPEACTAAYNEACRSHPDAGMLPLRVRPGEVELPLWAVTWRGARRRVLADTEDTPAILVDPRGEPIDRADVRPRALTMTAAMRSGLGDLFIHGKGGGVYERVTEHWLQHWLGETLNPMAVVSADLHLDLDVPVHDREELAHARWCAHHLPHNVDRVLGLIDDPGANAKVARKHALLKKLDGFHPKPKRSAWFQELHAINAELVAENPRLIEQAREFVRQCEAGVRNQAVAGRRDWAIPIYPKDKLVELRDAIRDALHG